MNPEEAKRRVEAELAGLSALLLRARAFRDGTSAEWLALSELHRDLIMIQINAMATYRAVLQTRLDLWGDGGAA
jgi:hypothetical protein